MIKIIPILIITSCFLEVLTHVNVVNYDWHANKKKATERHVKVHLKLHVYTKPLNDMICKRSVNDSFSPAPLSPCCILLYN